MKARIFSRQRVLCRTLYCHCTGTQTAGVLFPHQRTAGTEDPGPGGYWHTVPGSAAISADLATKLEVKINPSRLQVTTAVQGSPLEVVRTVANLVIATSTTNLLKLTNVVVYRNLGHPLNLGLNFGRQF